MRGVRWLGPTARIASFSSDKAQHGQAFRNALVITDVRSRSSLAFRWASGMIYAGVALPEQWSSPTCAHAPAWPSGPLRTMG